MISRHLILLMLATLVLPFRLHAAEPRYDTETVVVLLPKPSDLGADWHPVHPDRWLLSNPTKITAFYDYKPSKESGQKPDSVIADIFIFNSREEADKMIQALRQKTESVKENVIREAPKLSRHAFISHYGPEAHYGDRITFMLANLVITLSPSQNGMTVATKIIDALQTP